MLFTAQANICNAQNVDTRKGWDLRGHGFDSAMRFIINYYPELPIIIGVTTQEQKLLEGIKRIIRELDTEGYENITLLIHDQNPKSQTVGVNINSITFYKVGNPVACIRKEEINWGIAFIKHHRVTETIMLKQTKNEYPYTLIKATVKGLFKN